MSVIAKAELARFQSMYGWCNRLLRVDLSDARIWVEPTDERVIHFLGARGLAAKIIWDEYPQSVGAFDPRNPFMVMPGALTGTRSPYSGRTNICAFSPQCFPYEWFTRAGIGLDWGATLKKAGYDGLVVTGASTVPVEILICDDQVSVLSADELWGLDALDTQDATRATHGKHAKTLTIGPAGENLSRIATVHTGTTSVAGQGGFGAVMGSKKLKAITVIGSGEVPVADPERLQWFYREVGREVRHFRDGKARAAAVSKSLAEAGEKGRARSYACTASCPTPCSLWISDVDGRVLKRTLEGGQACVSGLFRGGGRNWLYDWLLTERETFEVNDFANRMGLNHWDILVGMAPWLRACEREDLFTEINGRALSWGQLEFWTELSRDIAYRQGMGDALAEGGFRAAQQLDLGTDLVQRYYTGWGYSGHWDGHAAFVNHIVYPFWIASAIHWAMDTRDPASSTHGYIQGAMFYGPWGFMYDKAGTEITWDHMRGIGEKVYGRADTLDPCSGYEGKEVPAAYHVVRSVMKDCLPTDDQVFPLIYSATSDDRFMRIGEIDGPDVDSHLFRAGTGLEWDGAEFTRTCERIVNLERANCVRHFGRDRQMDERVLPSFEYDENWVNLHICERKALDRKQFDPIMDRYLLRLGWDPETGWPSLAKLDELGLSDVHAPMLEGAQRAKDALPNLPAVGAVRDLHKADPDRQAGDKAPTSGH